MGRHWCWVDVLWSEYSGADKYVVYRTVDDAGPYWRGAVFAPDLEFLGDAYPNQGGTVSYQVAAKNIANVEITRSDCIVPPPVVEPRPEGENLVLSGLTQEQEQALLDEGVSVIELARPEAGPGDVVYEGESDLDGVRVVVHSVGGLHESDVSAVADDDLLIGLGQVAAGPVVDVTVSDPAAMTGATLTLPYMDEALVLSDEADLKIAWFDEDSQMWMPVNSEVTVDSAANTVTAEVDHFTRFAVVQGLS